MTAVRALLAKWRTATNGGADVSVVLARGGVPCHPDGARGALRRAVEQLADAITADEIAAALDRNEAALVAAEAAAATFAAKVDACATCRGRGVVLGGYGCGDGYEADCPTCAPLVIDCAPHGPASGGGL
jgi:hypothetical protein